MATSAAQSTPATGAQAGEQVAEELNVLTMMKALRDGEFIQELDDEITQLHEHVLEHGKSVSLTVKFTLTPSGRTISVEDDITAKAPKPPKEATLFFSDKGKFTRKDPKQADLSEIDPAFRGRGKGA